MASLDPTTRDRLIVLAWIALGVASLYRGFATSDPDPVLGVDWFVWLGVGYFVTGIVFWYELRSKRSGATGD